jgi:hypothetical protein
MAGSLAQASPKFARYPLRTKAGRARRRSSGFGIRVSGLTTTGLAPGP